MIHVENISFSYNSENMASPFSLKEVSLEIRPGESIALMGHNGSGKTTFARCLNALCVPQMGSVLVDGLSVTNEKDVPEIRRRVGMVFQNPDNQIVSTTVEREIAFGLENLGMPYEQMHQVVEEVLERFDLARYRRQSPHLLSGGEKQRLALAAVMAMQPRYLILDEPTSLLDPLGRREILSLVRDLHSEPDSEVCTILITQFPEEAMFVDRLIVFAKGKIMMDDDPLSIFERVADLQAIGLEPPLELKVKKMLSEYKTLSPAR